MSAITELIRHSKQSHTGKPLHECIEEALHRGLNVGQLKPGQKITLVDEVAHQWNVSRATVQQSMQVLAAKGVVVRKPRAGTFLASLPTLRGNGVSRSVSLVVPDIQIPEFASLARGIEDSVHEQGLSVVVCSTDYDLKRYEHALTRQIEAGVYGIFMAPPMGKPLPLELITRLHRSGIPVVTCYRSLYEMTGWPMIRTDGYQTMYMLASHLMDIGRRRIGFCGFQSHPKSTDKEPQMGHYGFLMALLERGTPPSPGEALFLAQVQTDDRADHQFMADQRQKIVQWISDHPQMDAICCTHDQWALIVLDVLKKLGRRVPDDVAVTGTGNLARFLGIGQHELTTADVDAPEFGRQFCRLISEVRAGHPLARSVVEVHGRLILGRSTVGQHKLSK